MKRLLGLIAMTLAAATQAGGQAPAREPAPRPAGAFNLRILSDSTPDFSTRENFVFSALSGHQTEHDRSLAQWRWMHRLRRVGSFAPEDSRPVLDPVLFFNSYGVTYCSMIAQMNCSIWEARGLKSRTLDLNGHVVSEVFHDGGWHMFDNDFCNYFLNAKGEVASGEELKNSRVHGNVADLEPGEFYIFDHCPAASHPRGRIFMGPSSASLIEVARDWWRPDKVRVRESYTGSHAGQRYVLGLRPGETYSRHWRPRGLGEHHARLFRNGKDPADDGTVLRNSRSNGEWTWHPDLTNPATFFAADNVRVGKDGMSMKDGTKPAWAVLRVSAANVITSGYAQVWNATSCPKFEVSANQGISWQEAPAAPGPNNYLTVQMPRCVAGRLEFLLKIALRDDAPLKTMQLNIHTQVNPRTLPALKLGANQIVAVSDGHFETVTFNPRLTGDQAKDEVFKLAGFQGIVKPTDAQPSLHSTGGDAELVLRATTPRPIRAIRMATTLHHAEPGGEFFMHASLDGGKTWRQLRHDYFAGWPADHRYQAMYEVPQPKAAGLEDGPREALTKYSFDSAGCGLVNVFAEANYEPAGPFMPYHVTYCWSEWRDGQWVERRHVERVDSPYHKYTINVGGTRPPRMNWVRVSEPGSITGDLAAGYSDGQDVGDKAARPGYRLELGKLLSKDCPYTVSRPASDAFPDVGGKVLTDGVFSVSSFWGLVDINLAGKKNERRVGDLVVWPAGAAGEEVAVTVDLGKAQPVGGARVCAVQPNEKVLYPSKIVVETSVDGQKFAPAGQIGWEDCFFPPADLMLWEGADSPVYEKLPAGGILDHRYAVAFERPVEARYVRVRLVPPADATAAMALWEVEVYDRLARVPFEDPVVLPAGPSARP